jgi:hypothetical protein
VWQDDDIQRSIRRYVAMALESPPWKVRVERREVRDEERPVGVVLIGPVTPLRARSSLIQGNIEEAMPVTVNLYPAIAEGSADDIRTSRLEAAKLKALLADLMTIGLTVTSEEEGRVRNWAGPMTLPLWDYDDVPVTGKDKAGPTNPHDVLWIIPGSLTTSAIQDPDDSHRWSVIASFRVSVERPGRVAPEEETMTVTKVVGSYGGERH